MADLKVFQNPIIPGFAPDPSVVRVGDTFFLVTSSFHVFPGLPIYASKDLQKWVNIGHGINRVDQLDLSGARTRIETLEEDHRLIATAGLLAPTIRYYKGTFYIVCTNDSRKGAGFCQNFYIKTDDIWSSNWGNPVHFDFDGIDTSLFFDDDDRAYIQGSNYFDISGNQPAATIKQFEIDIKTGKPLSETREIWPGFSRIYTEGPHIYKKDGHYFLMVAEGGTFEHHMLSMARSKNIWGPYETYENNPILTADGTNEYIQNTGHGEIFEDQHGQHWAAVLAVRKDGEGRYPMGRETFLTPVSWPSGGWPQIAQPKLSFCFSGPQGNFSAESAFVNYHGLLDFVQIRTPNPFSYLFDPIETKVTIFPSRTDLTDDASMVSFLGLRQPGLFSTATTTLMALSGGAGKRVKAGLALYYDSFRVVRIFVDFSASEIVWTAINKATGLDKELRYSLDHSADSVDLKVSSRETFYEFSFRISDASEWKVTGRIDAKEVTFRDFTGPIFGIFGTASSNVTSDWGIEFRNFRAYN
ncbi:hypothetical protein V499_00798 [Pseudogymnoascus sp. VKM F-103]|nr:hypothetical protein V499_00798 [Pseudogymnoascus sp. VKM F-103]